MSTQEKKHLPTCPKQRQKFEEKLWKMYAAQVTQYDQDPDSIPQSSPRSNKQYVFEACVYDIHNQAAHLSIKKQQLAALEVLQAHHSELEAAARQGLVDCIFNTVISCGPLGTVTAAIEDYQAICTNKAHAGTELPEAVEALESSRSKLEVQCRILERLRSSALQLHKSMIADFKEKVAGTKTTLFYKELTPVVQDAANKMALETEERMNNYTKFPEEAQRSLLRAHALLQQL